MADNSDQLNNSTLNGKVNDKPKAAASNTTKLTLHAYDWQVHYPDHVSDSTEIHCWALDRQSEIQLLRIKNVPIFMYVQLPEKVNGRKMNWDYNSAREVFNSIRWMSNRKKSGAVPVNFILERKRTLYYYSTKYHPMMRLIFRNTESMYNSVNVLRRPIKIKGLRWVQMQLKAWEANIPPIRKLLTLVGLKFGQWFDVNATPVTNDNYRLSKLPMEYSCLAQDIYANNTEESRDWITYPRCFTYDIEAYSANHDAFPNKRFATDVAYMISVVTYQMGKPETKQSYT